MSLRCEGPNCTLFVEPTGRGRPGRFCSDTCRVRSNRLSNHHALAVELAAAIEDASESRRIRALVVLSAVDLRRVLDALHARS